MFELRFILDRGTADMKQLIRLMILPSLFTCAAYADQFQLRGAAAGGFDVSYAKVDIVRDNTSIFSGRTDKLGRITITGLANGTYTGEVHDSQDVRKAIIFKIDGTSNLKIVEVR